MSLKAFCDAGAWMRGIAIVIAATFLLVPLSAAQTYTLTVQLSGGGSTDPAPGAYSFDLGTVAEVTAATDSGWFFDHWEVDGVPAGSAVPLQVTMDADHTVLALFLRSAYQLILSIGGSGTTTPEPGTYSYGYGTTATLEAFPDAAWSFAHWEINGSVSGENPVSLLMTADQVVEAVFAEEVRVLDIGVQGEGTVSPDAGTYAFPVRTRAQVTALAAAGWVFDHWEGPADDPGATATSVWMDADKSITAVFVPEPAAGVVQGTVRDSQSGVPLASVLIDVTNAVTGDLLEIVETSAQGAYSVDTQGGGIPLALTFAKQDYDAKEVTGIFAPALLNVSLVSIYPSVPTGLDGAAGATEILLWWDASGDADLAGYHVWRAEGAANPGDPSFTRLTDVPVASPGYHDVSGAVAETFTYYVVAVDGEGNLSEPSAPLNISPGLIEVWLPDVQGDLGEEIRLPINARNATGISPLGIDIKLQYDPSLTEYLGPESVRVERTVVTSDVMFEAYAPEAGRLNITCLTEGDTLRGLGHIFDVFLKFRADADSGACSLARFSDARFYDATPASLRVDFTDTAQFCTNVSCRLGDLNGDGAKDGLDVNLAMQIAVGMIEPDACKQSAGDINGDGMIDSADALLIQRMVSGLPINPPQPDELKSLRRQDWPLKDLIKQDTPKTVEIAAEDVAPGETVTVPLDIDDATGLSGCDLEVSFPSDRSMVTLIAVELGSLVADGFTSQVRTENGRALISMSTDSPLVDAGTGGTLAQLTFQISPNVPAGIALPISLGSAELKGGYGEDFAWYTGVNTVNGNLAVDDQSVLAVTPETSNASGTAGTATFEVINSGVGTMYWVSELTSGGAWASITSGAGGYNDGTVEVTYTENTTGENRTAELSVTTGSLDNTRTLQLVQASLDTYTLSVAKTGEGTVVPSEGTHVYAADTVVSLTATPASGWLFDHWTGSVADPALAQTTIAMDADQSVTAVFGAEGEGEGEGEGQPSCLGGALERRGASGDWAALLGAAAILLGFGRGRFPDRLPGVRGPAYGKTRSRS